MDKALVIPSLPQRDYNLCCRATLHGAFMSNRVFTYLTDNIQRCHFPPESVTHHIQTTRLGTNPSPTVQLRVHIKLNSMAEGGQVE